MHIGAIGGGLIDWQRSGEIIAPFPIGGHSDNMNEITLDVKIAKTKIDRNIYGHFSEHLGRCIYEGYWVGEDSADSQRARHPQRRGERAAQDQGAGHALARRLLRRRVPLDGRHRPARQAPHHDQHALGRRGREQPLRHPRVHGPVRAARVRAVCLRQRRQRHGAGDVAVGRVHDLRRQEPDDGPAPATTGAAIRGP